VFKTKQYSWLWLLWTAASFGIDFEKDSPWTLSLNTDWRFKLADRSQQTLLETFCRPDFDDAGFQSIPVPSNWELQGFEEPRYDRPDPEKVGLYRKTFSLPESWEGRQVFVHFEGVAFSYTLYLNGREIGGFNHTFLPCQFDLTPYVQKGENLLALLCRRDLPQTPFDCADDWALSGIYREVYLFSPSPYFLDNLTIETRIDPSRQSAQLQGHVDVRFFRRPASPKAPLPPLHLEVQLKNPDGQTVFQRTDPLIFATPEFFPHHSFQIPVKKARLWNAETPFLYELTLTLRVDGQENHRIRRKIGLREVAVENRVLKINGQPVKLRGVCRHETHPFVGRALQEQHWRQDIEMIKAANINAVRCSHYTPHPRFLELCDEYGLYVFDEVPICFGESFQADPRGLEAMLARAEEAVRRDRLHPSVIAWGIGNENPLSANLEKTAQFVKRMDPSRLVYYPGGDFRSSKSTADTGHAAFIDFYSRHYPKLNNIEKHVQDSTPPVPYLYSEFNHALDTAFGGLAPKWELMYKTPHIAGGFIWLWADQGIRRSINGRPVHNSYLDIENLGPSDLSGDIYLDENTLLDSHGQYGTDGIVYADRRPQTDYFQTRAVYSPIRILEKQISVKPGRQTVKLTVENRYDFTNLKECRAVCRLFQNTSLLSEHTLALSAPPHSTKTISIPLTLPDDLSNHACWMEILFQNSRNQPIAEYSVRLLPMTGKPDWFSRLDCTIPPSALTKNEETWQWNSTGLSLLVEPNGQITLKDQNQILLQGPYLRAGRKPTMAERRTFSSAKLQIWEPPLFTAEKILEQTQQQTPDGTALRFSMLFQSPDQTKSVQAQINCTLSPKGWLDFEYTLTPQTPQGALLECGLAFLLTQPPSSITWQGLGPYPAYPDKSELCRWGFHTIAPDFPFFDGNRMDVETALVTVGKTRVGILCPPGNLGWEKTPNGLLLFHNAAVAGLGTKFALPAPIEAANNLPLKGRFRIILFPAHHKNELLDAVFGKMNDR
jgi:beta-galactosidase